MSTPAPYAPPIDQPPAQPAAVPYGGFWIRFAAHFVDAVLISFGSIVVMLVWLVVAGKERADSLVPTFVSVLLAQLYHAYFVSSARMATPGKRLCGLYVTDLAGRRLSFGHALGRNLAALLSYLTLYIGFMMAGFTERKQALHDKIAGTLVHRQAGSGSGGGAVIAVVVGVFMFIAISGILAAIAIPAYQDYTVRAKVSGALMGMNDAKARVMQHAEKNQAWPTDWEQLGIANPVEQLNAQTRTIVTNAFLAEDGVIVIELKIHNNKEGQIHLTPSPQGTWTCSAAGDVVRYVPGACK
jgi:uncharacterized RDD family membrane protein YckC/Tfp pilus assembly major pilin PilA